MNVHRAIVRKFRIRRSIDARPRICEHGGTRIRLAELLGELGMNIGVEIGTHKGKYADVLCTMNKKLNLICIDPWLAYLRLSQDVQDQLAAMSTKRLAKHNVTIIRKKSMDVVDSFAPKSIDFAYIDGDHEPDPCCMDIIRWSAKVRPGGIVAVHDYYNLFWPGVTKAVDFYLDTHNIRHWYVTRERCSTAFWVNV